MTNSFDFGTALDHLKDGGKVCREGWNGKNMWLVLIQPSHSMFADYSGLYEMQPCIGMKNAQGQMQPGWLASQADLLASDWLIVG